MKTQTFEDYLMSKYIEDNPTILDDQIPDAFADYLSEVDPQEIIEQADKYLNVKINVIEEKLKEVILPVEVSKKEYKRVTNYLITIGFFKNLEVKS